MKKTLLTLAAMMFATSAMGQLQYDMTPDTGPVKGGANKVVTEVFTVEKKNGKWVRAGKPDPWGEMGVYPEESECTYDRNGKLTSKTTVFEGTKTEYAYQYTTDGKLAETKKTENGKLTSVMRYRYTAGKLTGTSEDTFYNGQKVRRTHPSLPARPRPTLPETLRSTATSPVTTLSGTNRAGCWNFPSTTRWTATWTRANIPTTRKDVS